MESSRVLVLDLERPSQLGDALVATLSHDGAGRFEVVREQAEGGDARPHVERHRADVVIAVLDGSEAGGVDYRPTEWPVPALAVLQAATVERLQELLGHGYADFLLPPLSEPAVVPRLWRLLAREGEPNRPRIRLKERLGLRRLIGRSPTFLEQVNKIPVVARCDAGVLISGATGTGKEVFARTIHYLSPRSKGPFIPVNCGAIPFDLLENELFGHERGAFTGADRRRPGLVEEADGGTLFLDEVDALPLPAQVKLLRFLEEKESRRLGSSRTQRSDVRVIAASNGDLEAALEEGSLRRDLYYRLNVLPFHLPSLEDRPEDVPLLARHFLARAAREFDRPLTGFSQGAMSRLTNYRWPGNVRELKHIVERAVVLSGDPVLLRKADIELVPAPGEEGGASFREAKARVVASFERRYVEKMLADHQGNISRAAAAGGKNRRAFWELIRRHKIDARRFRSPADRPAAVEPD